MEVWETNLHTQGGFIATARGIHINKLRSTPCSFLLFEKSNFSSLTAKRDVNTEQTVLTLLIEYCARQRVRVVEFIDFVILMFVEAQIVFRIGSNKSKLH
jgi:hypothetical protein